MISLGRVHSIDQLPRLGIDAALLCCDAVLWKKLDFPLPYFTLLLFSVTFYLAFYCYFTYGNENQYMNLDL